MRNVPSVDKVICLDANVLAKVYLPEPEREAAKALLRKAVQRENTLVGPAFLFAEVLSVFRKRIRRKELAIEIGEGAVRSLLALQMEVVDGSDVYERAWRIAARLDLLVIYDALYLAVAELRQAVFWTADRPLYEKAKGFGYLRLLGQDELGEAVRGADEEESP